MIQRENSIREESTYYYSKWENYDVRGSEKILIEISLANILAKYYFGKTSNFKLGHLRRTHGLELQIPKDVRSYFSCERSVDIGAHRSSKCDMV